MRFIPILILTVLVFMNDTNGYAQAANYPEFSWEKVPLYLFMRKADAYSQDELRFISTFPIVTVALTTGMNSYGSTEKGSLEAAKAVKELNQNTKILYYKNTMVHYAFYDADADLDSINEPFLRDSTGDTNLHLGLRPLYDLSNASLRRWWVDQVVDMSTHPEIDGIFFDGVGKVISSYLPPKVGEEKQLDVLEGYNALVEDCENRMDPSKIKLANLIRANFQNQGLDYLDAYDGSYIEHFRGDAIWTANSIRAAQTAARDGKIICMTFDMGDELPDGLEVWEKDGYIVGNDAFQDQFQYCLALFLICAEEYSYFYFHDGYGVNQFDNNRIWMKRFAEYDMPLGKPAGPAEQEGFVYKREFEHASVLVDIETKTASITWDSTSLNTKKTSSDLLLEACYKRGANQLEIRMIRARKATYSITNIGGSTIRSGHLENEITLIDTCDFVPGIYFVNVFSKEHRLTQKVVIN